MTLSTAPNPITLSHRFYETPCGTDVDVSSDGRRWFHVATFKETPEAERVYPGAIWWQFCDECAVAYQGENGCPECCDHSGMGRGPNPVGPCSICGKEWD